MLAGVAQRDITPPRPVAMSGFAARTRRSLGAHDPLLLFALVVEDTALVCVDVIGLDERLCDEIRARVPLPTEHVVVHAIHTHGGPVCMAGRLGAPLDVEWQRDLVEHAVSAVREAIARSKEVVLRGGSGDAVGVARNRRREDGPVDDSLPLLLFERADGSALAAVMSYACHPVVLGSDNPLLTADYPGVARRVLSAHLGGAPCLFVTGCAGDVNTGHKATDSYRGGGSQRRTFDECERVGSAVGGAAIDAISSGLEPLGEGTSARCAPVTLELDPEGDEEIDELVRSWRERREVGDEGERALYDSWIGWADGTRGHARESAWTGSVTVLRWGDAVFVALPGEPFAVAAEALRRAFNASVLIAAGYCNGSPGYLPAADEYAFGGYEVEDAHRYYGMPGPFRAGSLEGLIDTAISLGWR